MRKFHLIQHKPISSKKQKGAALLLFILLLVVGASTLLVSKLNKAAAQYYRDDVTMKALLKAKEALIGYAVSYPDSPIFQDINAGPGFFPCPDTGTDGQPDGPCGGAPNFALGRLPWVEIGLDDVRDSAGEQLWYSLSNNFRNHPKTFPLNSETAGELIVDDDPNSEIVAVIMAPGFSLDGQNRPSNTPSDYLEDDNNDGDSDFVTTASGSLNDQVLIITRQELMAAVEKRVIKEVAVLFDQYRDVIGNARFPWLSPYADPKVSSYTHLGIVTTGTSGLNLFDTNTNFDTLDVTANDVVENITDGSIGIVVGFVNATDLSVASLSGGIDNIFEVGDRYRILIDRSGTAGAGSTGNRLVDSTMNFSFRGVTSGDVIENLTTSTSGVITSVSSDTITVQEGSSITFASGNQYRIRSNAGTASSGSTTTLVDSSLNNDFSTVIPVLGIKPTDSNVVQNITDGSAGLVTAPLPNITTVNLNPLNGGAMNAFSSGDRYIFPRNNGVPNTQQGQIPFHEEGEVFSTSFDLTWNLPVTATVVCSQFDPANTVDYLSSTHLQSSTPSPPQIFTNSFCTWSEESHVKCWNTDFQEPPALQPEVASPGLIQCDSTLPQTRRATDIARRESSVRVNYHGDSLVGVSNNSRVRNVTSSTQAVDIEFSILDFDSSDNLIGHAELTYNGTLTSPGNAINIENIHYDFTELSGRATTGSSGRTLLDSSKDFLNRGIQIGDWVENLSTRKVGRVSMIDPTGSSITVVDKSSSAPVISFSVGDFYKVHHEIPKWFLTNQWHKLVYIAESSEEVPTGTGNCFGSGSNCLILNNVTPIDNHMMIIMVAGRELGLATQDRAGIASLDDYFEGAPSGDPLVESNENSDGVSPFDSQNFLPQLEIFNDQIISAKNCPPPNIGNICWQ